MKFEELKGLFSIAGIPILRSYRLANGYYFSIEGADDSPEETNDWTAKWCVNNPWWLVLTPLGEIIIGPRKRVIHIEWSETKYRKVVTDDDVTKSETMVHAWSMLKAAEYLSSLAAFCLIAPTSATGGDKP